MTTDPKRLAPREDLDRLLFYGNHRHSDGIHLGELLPSELIRCKLVQVAWLTSAGRVVPYEPGEAGHSGHERIYRVDVK